MNKKVLKNAYFYYTGKVFFIKNITNLKIDEKNRKIELYKLYITFTFKVMYFYNVYYWITLLLSSSLFIMMFIYLLTYLLSFFLCMYVYLSFFIYLIILYIIYYLPFYIIV